MEQPRGRPHAASRRAPRLGMSAQRHAAPAEAARSTAQTARGRLARPPAMYSTRAGWGDGRARLQLCADLRAQLRRDVRLPLRGSLGVHRQVGLIRLGLGRWVGLIRLALGRRPALAAHARRRAGAGRARPQRERARWQRRCAHLRPGSSAAIMSYEPADTARPALSACGVCTQCSNHAPPRLSCQRVAPTSGRL